MVAEERRKAERFKARLPVKWNGGAGLTRDFSAYGVYFHTEKSISCGQHIELVLLLEHVDPGRPVRLECLGEVVRVDPGEQEMGVAVAIGSYGFGCLNRSREVEIEYEKRR